MDVSASTVIAVCDRLGIVAFAFSGVEVGARRRLDLFGLLVMGLVTATGGGAMRDVALGRLPLVLKHEDYLLWAVGSSFVAIALAFRGWPVPRPVVAIADAVGLGAFAVAGAIAAISRDLSLPATVLLAILTATGGGVIRDLLADRVPLVLRAEINATAAGLGGMAAWAIEPASTGAAALGGAGLAAAVRIAGLALDLHLPRPRAGPDSLP